MQPKQLGQQSRPEHQPHTCLRLVPGALTSCKSNVQRSYKTGGQGHAHTVLDAGAHAPTPPLRNAAPPQSIGQSDARRPARRHARAAPSASRCAADSDLLVGGRVGQATLPYCPLPAGAWQLGPPASCRPPGRQVQAHEAGQGRLPYPVALRQQVRGGRGGQRLLVHLGREVQAHERVQRGQRVRALVHDAEYRAQDWRAHAHLARPGRAAPSGVLARTAPPRSRPRAGPPVAAICASYHQCQQFRWLLHGQRDSVTVHEQ